MIYVDNCIFHWSTFKTKKVNEEVLGLENNDLIQSNIKKVTFDYF